MMIMIIVHTFAKTKFEEIYTYILIVIILKLKKGLHTHYIP